MVKADRNTAELSSELQEIVYDRSGALMLLFAGALLGGLLCYPSKYFHCVICTVKLPDFA